MAKKLNTLEQEYTAAIFAVAKLIDAGANAEAVTAARVKRDALKKDIRKKLPAFDRGYT